MLIARRDLCTSSGASLEMIEVIRSSLVSSSFAASLFASFLQPVVDTLKIDAEILIKLFDFLNSKRNFSRGSNANKRSPTQSASLWRSSKSPSRLLSLLKKSGNDSLVS